MDYSLVVPVYNSADLLEELFARIVQTFQKMEGSFEVIFIDDYSRDRSWRVLSEIKQKNQDKCTIKLVQFSKNYGQHNATFCGLKFAEGAYVISMDDDLQNAPEDIVLLVDEIKNTGVDIVYGVSQKDYSKIRKAGTRFWKSLNGGLEDGSSFRVLSSSLVQRLLSHVQHVIYLDEMINWHTDEVGFVSVPHYKRRGGKSGYTPFRLFHFLFKLTFFYSTIPLKIMTYGGFALSIVTFLMGVRFIYKKIVHNIDFPGFTATIVAILFSTSLILICFGIVGKYLSNIFIALNKKPVYSIKDIKL